MKPLLEIQQLKCSYKSFRFARPTQIHHVLKGIDLHCEQGEILGLLGGSGCGKTTLSKCIAGLIKADEGRMTFQGHPLQHVHPKIQMIFQDPYSSLNPRMNIGDSISEPIQSPSYRRQIEDLSRKDISDRIAQSLIDVGLDPSASTRYPHQFSGGQLQRIGIARALITKPELIICDEPVSALDISIQAQILNLLKELQEKQSCSMIFVTHDIAVMRFIADRCCVMKEGLIVETASPDQLIQHPQHEETKKLIAAAPKSLEQASQRYSH